MSNEPKYITVFVPTYNREKYLPRLFDSLEKQTVRNFDVLVVDDGSTDNTEKLIQTYIETASFSIRYYKKKNGRKASAYNYGIPFIEGEITLELDSDDYVTPNALEVIEKEWKSYVAENSNMVAMRFLATYHHNQEIIGDQFPQGLKYTSLYDLRYKHKVKGDKTLIFLTKELKKHRFPNISSENVRMSIFYNRFCYNGGEIGVNNQALMVKEYLQGGITCNINSEKQIFKYPLSNALYYNELNYYKRRSIIAYLRHNAHYAKFEFANGKSVLEIYKNAIDKKGAFIFISILIGYVKYRKRLFKNR